MFFQPNQEGAASSKAGAQPGSKRDPPLHKQWLLSRRGERLGTALNATKLVTQEIKSPGASRMLAQVFLIQVQAGLLGQVGQTNRQRQSWELQKSHMWLLFHVY